MWNVKNKKNKKIKINKGKKKKIKKKKTLTLKRNLLINICKYTCSVNIYSCCTWHFCNKIYIKKTESSLHCGPLSTKHYS